MKKPIRSFEKTARIRSEAQYRTVGNRLHLIRWRVEVDGELTPWRTVRGTKGHVAGWPRTMPILKQ